MNDSYNLIDLLHQIIVLAAELVEAEAASLIIHDTRRDTLVILMPTGPTAEAVRDLEIPVSQGVAGWVYQNGRSVIVNDTASDTRFFPGVDRTTGFSSRQILCVPLTVKSRKLGAVEVLNKRAVNGDGAPAFTAEDQFLLEMFSTQAAIAIENTRLALALSRLEEEMPLEKKTAAEAERARAATRLSESFLAELKRSFIPLEGYSARMRESPSAEKVEKYGTYIEREMTRLMTRAEDIVQYLRDDCPLTLETVSLRDLLSELASRTWVDCRLAGITFEWSAEEDLADRGGQGAAPAKPREHFPQQPRGDERRPGGDGRARGGLHDHRAPCRPCRCRDRRDRHRPGHPRRGAGEDLRAVPRGGEARLGRARPCHGPARPRSTWRQHPC